MEKIALLFPGQGSQYIGMGKSLHEEYAIARQTFEEANDVLGFDLSALCFDGSYSDLGKSRIVQPAMLTASISAYRVYMQEVGIEPEFSAGHSLGEYTALTAGGAISFADALRLVRQRGELTQLLIDRGEGAMSIIDSISMEELEQVCLEISPYGDELSISCRNAPKQAAISGQAAAVAAAEERIGQSGGVATPLFMSAPFHSPMMAEVAMKLKETLQSIPYYPLRWPVISNVTGRPYPSHSSIAEMLALQLIQPVQWQATMQYLKRFGVTTTIELGPKNVLSALVEENVSGTRAYSFDQRMDRQQLIGSLNAMEELKKHNPTFLGRCLAIAAATPNANDNQEAYRQGVLESYQRLEQMQEQTERSGVPLSYEQMRTALDLLLTILRTKRISEEEQQEWVHLLREETQTYYTLADYSVALA
ncbi:ACP S-malonyltransferase [Paenibacillus sp. sgz5001063]|uniref:ACP S-malonyltransferase n=1 Tax=Paenibacillus sp. sgz5001063 TaxID=3242474 RepID=UPI0036D2A2E4